MPFALVCFALGPSDVVEEVSPGTLQFVLEGVELELAHQLKFPQQKAIAGRKHYIHYSYILPSLLFKLYTAV